MPENPTFRDKLTRLIELEREAAELRRELESSDESPRIAPFSPQDPEVWALLARFGSDFLSIHSPSGTYRFASPSVQWLFGWEPDDLLGTSAYDYFHPDDAKEVAENHEGHVAPDPVEPIEYRFRCADGSYRWVETRSKAYRDQDSVSSIICITRDVTERRRAEEARETLLADLRARLDQIETLQGLLPICSWCNSVRDDEGYWRSVADYLESSERVEVSHGICPKCLAEHFGREDEGSDGAR